VCQLRAGFVKDEDELETMWERQHELGAEKMYSLCSELGGLFLKAAQILGKPDLAPMAWVKRLVTLCDQAPSTPFDVVRDVVEKQLGKNFDDMFEFFDVEPVGSASIAQVHRARLKLSKTDVAVKVQHPGAEQLMMVDIRNMQAMALFLQKHDLNFDLFSATKEMEKQICYEFDFVREARAMERIREFLRVTNKKPPVMVPRVIPGMVSREVLIMEFIKGTPIMNLGNEMAKRGIDPGGKIAAMAKQKILSDLTLAYGQMILKDGFFHADPHPGNILICKDTEVALLDYGQVKEMPEDLRLAYANLHAMLISEQKYFMLRITIYPCTNVDGLILTYSITSTKIGPILVICLQIFYYYTTSNNSQQIINTKIMDMELSIIMYGVMHSLAPYSNQITKNNSLTCH
ncbi:hypothetical protein ACJX0J_035704, partial [Zea mays]